MSALAATLACFALFLAGYHLYAKHLGCHVFHLDPTAVTPAHELRDGFDYMPARKQVLFGHHFTSIAGLSPMLGPALAVIWGWVPAMLWIVFGTLLIGAVHDFGALVVSMRARGMSIGKVTESIVGPRAKNLFHAIIFFLIALAMGVFVQVVGQLFTADLYPESVLPSAALMGFAVIWGVLFYKKGLPIVPLTAVAFVLTLAATYVGIRVPTPDLSADGWNAVLLAYAFLASVLPIWLLLQPRGFLNALLLYLGLGSIFAGFLILRPDFVAPAIETHPDGAPPIFPFVFIIIACGAISGFHGLVSSGTTAKQIDNEAEAVYIGYGAMIGEGLLALAAVLACTTGFVDADAWRAHYASWSAAEGLGQSMTAFIDGSGRFLGTLGVSQELGRAFIALLVVSFALTTLDSATRLLRFNIQEIAETVKLPILGQRHVASLVAVLAIGFFAFVRVDGQPAGLALWALFGTTNQIMGGLTLLALTLYLIQRRGNYWYTAIPMVLMLVTTVSAMVINVKAFFSAGNYLLLAVGFSILALAVWLIVEGVLRVTRVRAGLPSQAPAAL